MHVALFCHADRFDAAEAADSLAALARFAPPDVSIHSYVGGWADGPRLARDAIAAAPSVVHLHGFGPATTWGLVAARRLRIPSVASWMAGTPQGARRLRRFRRCTSVLVPSMKIREDLVTAGFREDVVHVWQPGVDLGHFNPGRRRHDWRALWQTSERRPAVLYAASAPHCRRLELLRAVLNLLREHGVSHQPVVYGEDAPAFGSHVCGDWASVLASVDLVIAGPPAHGLRRLIVQSFACGVPVIVPEGDGAARIVDSGVTGYVCRDDDPIEFAWRASVLLRDGARRRQCAEAARHAAERYAWQVRAEPLYRLWREAASRGFAAGGRPSM